MASRTSGALAIGYYSKGCSAATCRYAATLNPKKTRPSYPAPYTSYHVPRPTYHVPRTPPHVPRTSLLAPRP